MPLDFETYDLQRRLARAALDGTPYQISGVSTESQRTYHGLISHGITDTLARAYPLARRILQDRRYLELSGWEYLMQEFLRWGAFPSPLLWKMPKSLLEFCSTSGIDHTLNLPFLKDLLLFEWQEIEVHMMPDIIREDLQPQGDLLTDFLVLNPESSLLSLEYPVFSTIDPEKLLLSKGEYHLFLFRNPETLQVSFLTLTAALATLLALLQEKPMKLSALVARSTTYQKIMSNDAASTPDSSNVVSDSLQSAFELLLKERALIGFLKEDSL